jgi:hypothetical protein
LDLQGDSWLKEDLTRLLEHCRDPDEPLGMVVLRHRTHEVNCRQLGSHFFGGLRLWWWRSSAQLHAQRTFGHAVEDPAPGANPALATATTPPSRLAKEAAPSRPLRYNNGRGVLDEIGRLQLAGVIMVNRNCCSSTHDRQR